MPFVNTTFRTFSREEEVELFRRWRDEGDREAYESIVESQLAWARKLAAKYGCCRSESDDIDIAESAAFEGVLKAVESFDPSMGNRLTTLVEIAVRQCLQRRDMGGPVKVPANKGAITEEHMPFYERAIAPEALRIGRGEDFGHDVVYNEDPIDALISLEASSRNRERVEWAMARLPERLRLILKRRFWDGLTLSETGDEFDLTKERIRQLETKGLKKIQALLKDWRPSSPQPEEVKMDEEKGDLLSVLDNLSQGQIEREIQKLTDQRNVLASQFDEKINRLTGLRNAMFGKPQKIAKAKSAYTPKGGRAKEPHEGSQTRAAWELLKSNGPLHYVEIAKRLGVDDERKLSSMISVSVGRWFERTAPGTYAAIAAEQVA